MSKLPCILIVDDDRDFARLAQVSLEETGRFSVKTCDDAEKALEIIKADPPDVITLDLIMPEKSGGWLHEQLRNDEDLRDIPVIIMSALVGHPDGKRIPERPENSDVTYLWKPLDPDLLIGAIHGELHKKKS